MPIAQAAAHAGLSQATIRFYEKSGMLPKIARNAQGWRDVHGDTLTWLVTLGHLRSTGMALANVKRFAQSAHAPDCDSEPQARMRLALLRKRAARLAMGIFGGKYDAGTQFKADDARGTDEGWMAYFQDGKIKDTHLAQLNGVRDVLTSGGRTLAQGAIAWLWARSPSALPIPGFRTPEQVTDLCGALDHGPLTPQQMAEIETILDRPPEGPPTAR